MIDVVARLTAAGCVAPEAEARALLVDARDEEELEARVRRRETGEPLAWIVGRVRFGGLDVHVLPGVYVPRAQTAALASRAAEALHPNGVAVDLCTGSGAVAAWLQRAHRDAFVIGVDVDPTAARCARRNGVRAVIGDLATALRASGAVDVVTAVAPYVPTDERRLLPADVRRHEPARALDGGDDGLTVVRRVVAHAAELLHPGGQLFLELGGEQDVVLAPDLARHGFASAESWHDDEGDLRGLVARR